MDRRNFITGCAFCAAVAAVAACGIRLSSGKISSNADKWENGTFIRNIDIQIVEHCNLNCKFCHHFAPIAEEKYTSVADFEKDILKLAEITKSRIKIITLLGGEPLLHPNFNELTDIVRKYFPDSRIDIMTNALLLNSLGEDFWHTMHKNNVYITPSIYPVNLDWKTTFRKGKKYKVKITRDESEEKLTMESIQKYKIKQFGKLNLDLNGGQNPYETYRMCSENKTGCIRFGNGKIFPCFVVRDIHIFNKKFGKNLIVTNKDYLDIHNNPNLDDILTFLKTPVPFCKYCKGMSSSNENWVSLKEHSITEWT